MHLINAPQALNPRKARTGNFGNFGNFGDFGNLAPKSQIIQSGAAGGEADS
jgi:hypothetical protein